MITITGTVLDASGTAVGGAVLHFLSTSTPIAGSGAVIVNSEILKTVANDGTFSQPLEPGDYQVQVSANNKTTKFNLAIPPGSGSATIDTLITSELVYSFAGIASTWPGTNFRIKENLGLQIFNNDTGLWHTLTVVGNPPQLGLDAGTA